MGPAFEARLRSAISCRGRIELPKPAEQVDRWAEEPVFDLPPIKCPDFEGHLHVPLWITPALFALVFVGCLLGCFRKRRELVHTVGAPQRGSKPLRNVRCSM